MKHRLALLLLPITFLFFAHPGEGQDIPLAPDIEVAPEMELLPTDCGTLAEPIALHSMIPKAIGASPIWTALPNWEGQTKGTLAMPGRHYQENPQLEGWWSIKLAWFVTEAYEGEVELQGFNIADDSPIYFEFNDGPTTSATLNPAQPGAFVEELEGWAFFPSYVWVSKAGCYQLQASWDGGLWQQIIAVGGVEDW
jgi:hypothetical protein